MSFYTGRTIWLKVSDELHMIWKEAVLALFAVLFRHSPGRTEENHEELQT
jgi:hypothetical protein